MAHVLGAGLMGAFLKNSEYVTIRQSGTLTVVQQVPAYAWRCNECGWLGTGHLNEVAALKEASDHMWDEHRIALCADINGEKQYGHPGHRWQRVPGTDAVDKCIRCTTTIGK